MTQPTEKQDDTMTTVNAELVSLLKSAVGGVGYLAGVAGVHTEEWRIWENKVRAAIARAESLPTADLAGTKDSKGAYEGTCNRTACQHDRNVVFLNSATGKYYCPSCARKINDGSPNMTLCRLVSREEMQSMADAEDDLAGTKDITCSVYGHLIDPAYGKCARCGLRVDHPATEGVKPKSTADQIIADLRAAGGDGWDKVEDVNALLGRDAQPPAATGQGADVWHYMMCPGLTQCGADHANVQKTEAINHVTCLYCLRQLAFLAVKVASPSDAKQHVPTEAARGEVGK